MTKTEAKRKAQDMLVNAAMTAFYAVYDGEEKDPAVLVALETQARRIEKLFGYEPGSWMRS